MGEEVVYSKRTTESSPSCGAKTQLYIYYKFVCRSEQKEEDIVALVTSTHHFSKAGNFNEGVRLSTYMLIRHRNELALLEWNDSSSTVKCGELVLKQVNCLIISYGIFLGNTVLGFRLRSGFFRPFVDSWYVISSRVPVPHAGAIPVSFSHTSSLSLSPFTQYWNPSPFSMKIFIEPKAFFFLFSPQRDTLLSSSLVCSQPTLHRKRSLHEHDHEFVIEQNSHPSRICISPTHSCKEKTTSGAFSSPSSSIDQV